MKRDFFDYLFQWMSKNKDIYAIFIDLGWPRYDEFKEAFGDRAINTGAAEQTALDIAVGLAYEGKIPFVYTITPFFWRAAETIRLYINHDILNVKLIGAGRDSDYSKDHGFSHDAKDIKKLFRIFRNILDLYPETTEEMKLNVAEMIKTKRPYFLNLKR